MRWHQRGWGPPIKSRLIRLYAHRDLITLKALRCSRRATAIFRRVGSLPCALCAASVRRSLLGQPNV